VKLRVRLIGWEFGNGSHRPEVLLAKGRKKRPVLIWRANSPMRFWEVESLLTAVRDKSRSFQIFRWSVGASFLAIQLARSPTPWKLNRVVHGVRA